MIIAELDSIVCYSVMEGFEKYVPENGECFSIEIQVDVGIKGQEGAEIFSFNVCTAKWLEENYKDEIVFLRHIILVPYFNYEMLKNRIEKLIKSIHAETWNEYAEKLSRYGYWEFEDYQDISCNV